jgi:hypothetical protein
MSKFFRKRKDAKETGKDTLDIKESMKSSDHDRIDLDVGPFYGAVNLTKAGEALRRIAEKSIEVGKPVSVRDVTKHLSITTNDVMALLQMNKQTAEVMKQRIINYRIVDVSGDRHIHFSY